MYFYVYNIGEYVAKTWNHYMNLEEKHSYLSLVPLGAYHPLENKDISNDYKENNPTVKLSQNEKIIRVLIQSYLNPIWEEGR